LNILLHVVILWLLAQWRLYGSKRSVTAVVALTATEMMVSISPSLDANDQNHVKFLSL
jgi:hypothetical protein